jgi:recombination protein RecR
MAELLPHALTRVIDELGRLPGVGARTAERYAYYLLRADARTSDGLAGAIAELHRGVKTCPVTFALIDPDQDISPLYAERGRNKKLVAIVEEPLDIVALEKTGAFRGTYHVLGGLVSPIDGITPDELHIAELMQRIDDDAVEEIILATNASVEGESTALYIQQQIGERKVRVTRLARGLPIGVDLEYADQITLSRALEGRQALS